MGLRGPGAKPVKAPKQRKKSRGSPVWDDPTLPRWRRVVVFLESLPITKGILQGERMKLLPGQVDFIRGVYGNLDADGRRRTRVAIKSEPAGNGKTGFVAGLHCCHLLGPEAEPRGEIDAAAVDRTQSSKMFDEVEAIIREVPEFAARVNIKQHEKIIAVTEGAGKGSKFYAMSGDARKGHGLAPSFWAYDELAQVPDRALLDNLLVRMGKRQQALGIIISTQAPNDDHPLSQLIDDGLAKNDPSLYVHLTAAPAECDPFDWKTIESVNEALGIFLNPVDVRNDMERARRLPAWLPKFLNERLNQRVDANQEDRLCTAAVWKQGNVPVDRESLRGRVCYAALDLSGKHDLTSLTLAFPDDQEEPHYDILPFFWTPEGQLGARRPAEQERFREWIRRKLITPVPGPTIRFGFIARELVKLAEEFDIRVLGYDRWRIDDFKQDLLEADADFPVPLEPFGQGFKEMGPAVEWFAELALTGRIHHGGHPVLTACVANAILTPDPAGNQKIDKASSNGRGPVRIDGAVTLCMALELAKRFVGVEGGVNLQAFLDNPVMVV
jgi:phage terminase large subunit-like protein